MWNTVWCINMHLSYATRDWVVAMGDSSNHSAL